MRVTDFVSCAVLVMKEKRGTCWIYRLDQLRLRKSCPACQGQHVWPYVYFPTIKHFHSSVPTIILFRLVHNDAYTEISRPGFMRQGFFIFCSFPCRTGYNFCLMLLHFVGLHFTKAKTIWIWSSATLKTVYLTSLLGIYVCVAKIIAPCVSPNVRRYVLVILVAHPEVGG